MLIDTETLRRHPGNPACVVFDCRHDLLDHGRGERLYREGHLPGAFFVPFEAVLAGAKTGRNGRHPLPVADAFAAWLNRYGVDAHTQIVAYDDVGGQYAARLWWLCRWIGHTRAGVLDGGLARWIATGGPIEAGTPVARGGGTVVARPDDGQWRRAAEVAAGLAAGAGVVIDARAPERFSGETEPIDPVAGHIPGARNRFFKANLNADLTMRPAAELRREFEAILGGRPAASVIHQCGSGVTACVNLLAMEHAGLPGSTLYAGSWSEWCSDPARPVARG